MPFQFMFSDTEWKLMTGFNRTRALYSKHPPSVHKFHEACLARRWWGIDPWFTPLSHLDFGFNEGLDSSLVASSGQENCEAGMPHPMS